MTTVRHIYSYHPKLILFLALVVAYDYHPNAQTLYDAHLKPKAPTFHNGRLQTQSTTVSERTMWTYVVQIANAIKVVHDAGLAVRMIDATKILLTGKNRCSHHSYFWNSIA
jgi:PAB-dependent poly(A)-specific ribonuclease subunit 3